LTTQKDFGTLIRAFNIVLKDRPAKLLIIGEGTEKDNLEGLINDLSLQDDIHLLGFVKNPYKYMKKSSLFVLTSRWEGFGNV
ncbi:glycosyltransferase, partial [Pantoea sp. SIMBA_133]